MTFIDKIASKEEKVKLINTLRTVTDGKVQGTLTLHAVRAPPCLHEPCCSPFIPVVARLGCRCTTMAVVVDVLAS